MSGPNKVVFDDSAERSWQTDTRTRSFERPFLCLDWISGILKLTVIRMITFFFKLIFRDECFQVTFESSLAMIGGTMGLLTGFSILSGVEIIFFLIKILIKGFRDGKEMLATGNKKWNNLVNCIWIDCLCITLNSNIIVTLVVVC